MFTGIVEEVGSVKRIISGANSGSIEINAGKVLQNTKIGDSIAVNGVCLTVTSMGAGSFTSDVMPETMGRTNLGSLKNGSMVNLERAMAADGRFGGHIVSGHIDGTGTIIKTEADENAIWVKIAAAPDILALIVEKGSITIDGISLTVAKLDSESFSVSIIPHTASETTLLTKQVGAKVNLENDIVGKYVQRLLGFSKPEKAKAESKITMDFLIENGF